MIENRVETIVLEVFDKTVLDTYLKALLTGDPINGAHIVGIASGDLLEKNTKLHEKIDQMEEQNAKLKKKLEAILKVMK